MLVIQLGTVAMFCKEKNVKNHLFYGVYSAIVLFGCSVRPLIWSNLHPQKKN